MKITLSTSEEMELTKREELIYSQGVEDANGQLHWKELIMGFVWGMLFLAIVSSITSCNNPPEPKPAPVDSVVVPQIGRHGSFDINTQSGGISLNEQVDNLFGRSMGQINELIDLCRAAQKQRDSIYVLLIQERGDRYSSDGGIALAPGESMTITETFKIDTAIFGKPWIPDTILHDGNPWIDKPKSDTAKYYYRVIGYDGEEKLVPIDWIQRAKWSSRPKPSVDSVEVGKVKGGGK